MSQCRICRTENNLKYSLKELRRINKKLGNSSQQLLHASVPAAQSGNICYDCEDRLHNFHKLLEEDDDVDVDCSGDARVREESPIIVDDDELLYNMFFNKNKEKLPSQKDRLQTVVTQREFTQHSLGSDGDTEIIEVLTSSRESTPANDIVNSSVNHLIPNISTATAFASKPVSIEIIDLEQDDEKKTDKSDDEEIVFRRVEPNSSVNKINCVDKKSKTKRISKRRYSDSETKLIASLSLVSSDSESELPVNIIQKLSPIKSSPDKATTITTLAAVQLFACNLCDLNFPAVTELQSHQLTHTSVSCPVCNAGFPLSQRLVHHMRSKHRSYAGSMLSERSKCPQDSAMTIRLRYMQRYTYYECQLCGQIDAVFKNHKIHVITKHEDESKSLKDPMMKELKCHICKEKCGTQYLTLCCHLRQQHADKHEPQLREVIHSHPFGWNAARQRDVECSAKVFQFSARKSRYFECKICKKVTAGYFKHWKHLNIHSNGSHEKLIKCIEEINQLEAKKTETAVVNKYESMPAKKSEKTAKKQVKKKVLQNESKRLKATSPPNEIKDKKPKKLGKMNKKALKAALVKVKVRPVLQRFPTQKYKCKFCKKKFKGFYCLNRHQIEKHLQDEYHFCVECKKAFLRVDKLKMHTKDHHTSEQEIINLDEDLPRHRHHKRKCRGFSFNARNKNDGKITLLDENCNTDSNCIGTTLIVGNGNVIGEQKMAATCDIGSSSIWLKDLMRFAVRQRIKTNNVEPIYQCQYCTRLFSEHRVMLLHEQGHATRQDVPMIKRIALTVPKGT